MDTLYTFIKKYSSKSGTSVMVLLGLIGVLMISAGELFVEKEQTDNYYENPATYKIQLENELKDILSSINGAGDVEVMITLESGKETIYAWQEKTTRDEQSVPADLSGKQTEKYTFENQIVLVDQGNEKQALIEKILEPVVQGVVVVSSGADDITVVSNITNAVSVALNVTSNRICVIKMK